LDRSLGTEARALAAAARALLRELVEEGVDWFPRPAAPAPASTAARATLRAPARSPEPAARAAPTPPAETAAAQPSLLRTPSPFGERPTLADVREALGDCKRCRLHEGRNRIVFGDGNPQAKLLFVGEGPGENEDLQGLPFVGRAGELLTQMIEKGLGIPRSSVYICNIVKCRPPGNRTPLADEVSSCRPFLDGQIQAVSPAVIVALGKPAASLLLGREISITRVRGTWQDYRGIPVMPTFHPAFVLRQYTAENRRLVWEDLKAALARSGTGRHAEGALAR
jgi:DNA polymerase